MSTWTIDKAKTPKRKKPPQDSQTLSKSVRFDEYVSKKYQEFVNQLASERADILQSLDKLSTEEFRIKDNSSRGLIRRKLQLKKDQELLQKKLTSIDDGTRTEEFKQKIVPFAEAYEREQQVHSMERLRQSTNETVYLPKEENMDPQLLTNVMKDYMHEVEHVPVDIRVIPNEICEECDDIMILESRSSTLICPCCGNWKYYLDATSSHMAYGEEVEFTVFAYLRMNHFNERLTYSQAKESTRIAMEDIQKVMDRLIERRIADVEKITMEMTYSIAKELKMRHVYKQNTQLWCRITGKPPLRMTPEQEERLRSMFRAVNRLWLKYKPDERKNFLSYNYIIYKFCQLLGMDKFCGLYKLLKGDKKLEKQDEIFKKICEDPELQWEFIPSRHDD